MLLIAAIDNGPVRIGVAIGIFIVGALLSRLSRWDLDKWFRRDQTESFARVMSKIGGTLLSDVASPSSSGSPTRTMSRRRGR